MENFVVVSKSTIGEEAVRSLVGRYGGSWFTDGKGYGVVQRGEAWIDVDLTGLEDYEPEELVALRRILGGEPTSCVGVGFSRNEPSEKLAREFCDAIIEAFGGFFDDNYTDIV